VPDFLSILATEGDLETLAEPLRSQVLEHVPKVGDDLHTHTTLLEALQRVHALAPHACARIATSSTGIGRSLYQLDGSGALCVAFGLATADGKQIDADRLFMPEVKLTVDADALTPLFEDSEGLDVLDEKLVQVPFHFDSAEAARRSLSVVAEVMKPAEARLVIDADDQRLLATLRRKEGARFDRLRFTCGSPELDALLERMAGARGELGIETGAFHRESVPDEVQSLLRPAKKRNAAKPYTTGSASSRVSSVEEVRREQIQAEVPKLVEALDDPENTGPAGRDVRGSIYFALSGFPTELVGAALHEALRKEEDEQPAERLVEALWRHPTLIERCVREDLLAASRSHPPYALRIVRAAKAARHSVPEEILGQLPEELQRFFRSRS
jgi:hypothetical protein